MLPTIDASKSERIKQIVHNYQEVNKCTLSLWSNIV